MSGRMEENTICTLNIVIDWWINLCVHNKLSHVERLHVVQVSDQVRHKSYCKAKEDS